MSRSRKSHCQVPRCQTWRRPAEGKHILPLVAAAVFGNDAPQWSPVNFKAVVLAEKENMK